MFIEMLFYSLSIGFRMAGGVWGAVDRMVRDLQNQLLVFEQYILQDDRELVVDIGDFLSLFHFFCQIEQNQIIEGDELLHEVDLLVLVSDVLLAAVDALQAGVDV